MATNPTNPNRNSKGNPNPTNPTNPTNPANRNTGTVVNKAPTSGSYKMRKCESAKVNMYKMRK